MSVWEHFRRPKLFRSEDFKYLLVEPTLDQKYPFADAVTSAEIRYRMAIRYSIDQAILARAEEEFYFCRRYGLTWPDAIQSARSKILADGTLTEEESRARMIESYTTLRDRISLDFDVEVAIDLQNAANNPELSHDERVTNHASLNAHIFGIPEEQLDSLIPASYDYFKAMSHVEESWRLEDEGENARREWNKAEEYFRNYNEVLGDLLPESTVTR